MEKVIPEPELGSVLHSTIGNGLPLLISFAGLGDEFEFRRTLERFKVNVIYLRDLKHNWYLNGIPHVAPEVTSLAHFLKDSIRELAPSQVVTMGASAGGFAALLYGCLLQADKIIAFSPQTFMDKWHRTLYYDYRWRDRVQQIYKGPVSNRAFLDVKPLVKSFKNEGYLFYDNTHRLDNLHGRRIKQKNITHIKISKGGHNLVKSLRDSGELHTHLTSILKLI